MRLAAAIIRSTIALFLVVVFAATAMADAYRVGPGYLWRVDGGARPSYLLGTFHTSDPRVTNVPGPVLDALDSVDALAVELIVNEEVIAQLGRAMFTGPPVDLLGGLGEELYAKVVGILKERGIPEQMIDLLQPWAVSLLLAFPEESGPVLDQQLQDRAWAKDKTLYGLETAEEQIGVFSGLSMADQMVLLRLQIMDHDQASDLQEEMVRLYLAHDLDALMDFTDQMLGSDPSGASARANDRLLDQRNRLMAARLLSVLADESVFIAVGAAHLPGSAGLIALLRAAGYDVRAVY